MIYGGAEGPDLEDVARLHNLTARQAVEMHSSAEYVVYFLGFQPGFGYLGGLPEALHTPRAPFPELKYRRARWVSAAAIPAFIR